MFKKFKKIICQHEDINNFNINYDIYRRDNQRLLFAIFGVGASLFVYNVHRFDILEKKLEQKRCNNQTYIVDYIRHIIDKIDNNIGKIKNDMVKINDSIKNDIVKTNDIVKINDSIKNDKAKTNDSIKNDSIKNDSIKNDIAKTNDSIKNDSK